MDCDGDLFAIGDASASDDWFKEEGIFDSGRITLGRSAACTNNRRERWIQQSLRLCSKQLDSILPRLPPECGGDCAKDRIYQSIVEVFRGRGHWCSSVHSLEKLTVAVAYIQARQNEGAHPIIEDYCRVARITRRSMRHYVLTTLTILGLSGKLPPPDPRGTVCRVLREYFKFLQNGPVKQDDRTICKIAIEAKLERGAMKQSSRKRRRKELLPIENAEDVDLFGTEESLTAQDAEFSLDDVPTGSTVTPIDSAYQSPQPDSDLNLDKLFEMEPDATSDDVADDGFETLFAFDAVASDSGELTNYVEPGWNSTVEDRWRETACKVVSIIEPDWVDALGCRKKVRNSALWVGGILAVSGSLTVPAVPSSFLKRGTIANFLQLSDRNLATQGIPQINRQLAAAARKLGLWTQKESTAVSLCNASFVMSIKRMLNDTVL